MLFAGLAIPVMGFVALSVDAGSAVWTKAQFDLAANAAALTAVMTGANAFAQNASASMVPAQQAGTARFVAQAGAVPGATLGALSVAVTVTGGTITAAVNYTAATKTRFAQLFGVGSIPAAGQVTVARTNSPFFDIEVLMDNSSSMAIASTLAGMAQLGAAVQRSPLFAQWGQNQACAFGCHFDAHNNDFFGIARANNIQLRIDVLSQAVQGVVNTIMQSPAAGQFRVGLYTFNTALGVVYPTNTNLAGAVTAAQQITVPVTTAGNDADSNMPAAMQALTSQIPAAGDGSTASAPRRYVFIVSDGVEDYYSASNRIMAPFDPTLCNALKAKGVQVLTLYTQYIPIPTNAFYNSNIAPFSGSIGPNLQKCASSPSFFFQASDPTSINAALQAMLQAALAAPAKFSL